MKSVLIVTVALFMCFSAAYCQQTLDTLNRPGQQTDLYRHDASGLHRQRDTTITNTEDRSNTDGAANMQTGPKDTSPSQTYDSRDGAANMQPDSSSSPTQYKTDQGTKDDGAANMQTQPRGRDGGHADDGGKPLHKNSKREKNGTKPGT